MDHQNYHSLPLEQIISHFHETAPEGILHFVSNLNNDQLTACIVSLYDSPYTKLITLVQSLKENSLLEAIGKGLSLNQFQIILECISKKNCPIENLAPLLVGLPFPIFVKALQNSSGLFSAVLRDLDILEPLQYHLNLLGHHFEKILIELKQRSDSIITEIQNLNINKLEQADLRSIRNEIKALEDDYEVTFEMIDKALSIIWNTTRIDLIEKFSHIKEFAQEQFVLSIGIKDNSMQGKDLYSILDNALNKVFEISSSEDSPEALKDEDHAIEGLSKLSIWYLKDYWEIGLLPTIKDPNELELLSSTQLFNKVQNNLSHLGIKTIKDLKKAQIYSKKMLKEYIQERLNLLT